MSKYIVINKITGEEVSNELEDALEARVFIAHLENNFPSKYPKGILCWTKKSNK